MFGRGPREMLQVGVGRYTVASLQTASKRKMPALAKQAQCIASAMMAAIKPNVVSQQRAPISKSALLLILLNSSGWGTCYLHETADFVNTRNAGAQNCHSYFNFGSQLPRTLRAPPAKKPARLVWTLAFCRC
jgi:hypothetical protein